MQKPIHQNSIFKLKNDILQMTPFTFKIKWREATEIRFTNSGQKLSKDKKGGSKIG